MATSGGLPLARARLRCAQAEIALLVGDLTTAADAVEEVERVAESHDSPGFTAAARHARGALLLARGLPTEAVPWLHDACAAHRHAGLDQGVQKTEEEGIENLFGERLLAGQPETGRKVLGDRQLHRAAVGASAAIATVGQREGSLHHRPAAAVDVILAARKPAEVAGVGSVESHGWRSSSRMPELSNWNTP